MPTTVARLGGLPAGSYVLSSVAQVVDFTNPGQIVACDIRANGEVVATSSVVAGIGAGSLRSAVASAGTGVSRPTPFDLTLECRPDGAYSQPAGVQNQHLTATRVASLHKTP